MLSVTKYCYETLTKLSVFIALYYMYITSVFLFTVLRYARRYMLLCVSVLPSFLVPKISAEFQWGHPQRGPQIEVE